ncbi:hypothetical protein H6F90_01030 [Trichocoleus sp. FACHB-591]|uniref:hypothetical protein n=1 Tax=Trichocoleus sp. FACHB-591 TaxID=2692872 RepID=UPI00198FFDB2|nr:hypothetical protein [Trichocoleus sp. FACHB-591]MBD2093738.1 hypothetical protein [Trichocoleus sp. FACHB-591]MBD2121003.1 hypothetical protein [Trichocoleus sp. FACHB-262]
MSFSDSSVYVHSHSGSYLSHIPHELFQVLGMHCIEMFVSDRRRQLSQLRRLLEELSDVLNSREGDS